MADIFLSYNETDRPTAGRLAALLQSQGWSVWWDRRIPAGQTWRSVIEHELQHMRCMLVLWSAQSVRSEWVCEEAGEGRRLGRLLPVLIEPVRPPAGFREVQAADLVGWDGSREFAGFQLLIEDIARLVPVAVVPNAPPLAGPPAHGVAVQAAAGNSLRAWHGLLALAVAGLLAALGWLALRPPALTGLDGQHAMQPGPPQPTASAASAPAAGAVPMPRPIPVPAIAASATRPAPLAAAPTAQPPSQAPGPDTAPAAEKRKKLPSDSTQTAARCADVNARLALGEPLSPTSQTFLRNHCQR